MVDLETLDQVLATIKVLLDKQIVATQEFPGERMPASDPERAQAQYYKSLYSDMRLIASIADGLATTLSDPAIG